MESKRRSKRRGKRRRELRGRGKLLKNICQTLLDEFTSHIMFHSSLSLLSVFNVYVR